MIQTTILNPKIATAGHLIVDITVKLPSTVHHISRLKYTGKGLYDVPLTYRDHKCHIDIHTSYHPSGEMHGKLTRGELSVYPDGKVLAMAKPHT